MLHTHPLFAIASVSTKLFFAKNKLAMGVKIFCHGLYPLILFFPASFLFTPINTFFSPTSDLFTSIF
jgi:hypothetical protein